MVSITGDTSVDGFISNRGLKFTSPVPRRDSTDDTDILVVVGGSGEVQRMSRQQLVTEVQVEISVNIVTAYVISRIGV